MRSILSLVAADALSNTTKTNINHNFAFMYTGVNYYNTDYKDNNGITVILNSIKYLIPYYCLTFALRNMPEDFYKVNKTDWLAHPLFFTTIEMVKECITI